MLYIYTHQGLGDQIICNGLVRHFASLEGQLTIFTKTHYESNVKWMYRDNPNIHIISLDGDNEMVEYINQNRVLPNTLIVGFDGLRYERMAFPTKTFDEEFYEICGLPFDFRFSKFEFVRDSEREKMAYEFVNPSNEPYIFVHGDVDRTKIRSDLKIIENPQDFLILDLLYILENAEEIHLMESSIKCLVNSYDFTKPKLFFHRYVRGRNDYADSKGINKYEVVD